MKKLLLISIHCVLVSALMVLLISNAIAQSPDTDRQIGLRLQTLSTGEKLLSWNGQENHTYFFQASPDFGDWTWAPNIETGLNGPMSYQVDGPTAKGFFRLIRTDQTAADPDTADFDDDGLGNLYEITPRPRPGGIVGHAGLNPNIQTNPIDADTDHDGLNDKWEQDHGLDPTDNGSRDVNNGPNGDPDGDGFTNLSEQAAATNPQDSSSYPPGTPLPGGAPQLVGEQLTFSGTRWGWSGFQNPAKRYLKKVGHVVNTAGPAHPDFAGDITYTNTIDDLKTGHVTYTSTGTYAWDYADLNGPDWTVASDVSRSRAGVAEFYFGQASSTSSETLSDENTIPAFVANVESWCPAYQNKFTVADYWVPPHEYIAMFHTITANISLTPEATDPYPAIYYNITKLKYKWKVNAAPNQVVNWLEVFTPSDGTTSSADIKSWTPSSTDTESPVYEIDPTTRNTKKSGTYALLPVEVEIKRGGLGTNLPPPALPQAPVLPTWQSQGGKARDLVSVWDAHTSSAQVADLKGDWMQARIKPGGLTAADLPPNFVVWLIDGHPAPAPNTLETPRLSWSGNFGIKKVQVTIGGKIFKVHVDVPNVGTLDHVGWGAVMVVVHGPLDGPAGAALAKSYATSETAWSDAYAGKPSMRNALRHSSWIAHCASLNLINPAMADQLGKAHEYDNFSSGNNWAYEATMDLHNNAIGATCIHSNFLGFPDTAAIHNDVIAKLTAGELWIWDSAGLEHTGFKATMKSNNLPINP